METLRFGREIRWLFQAALLIFLVTVALGIAGGMGIVDFSEENQVLTHLHSGVIGWVTLGVLAAVLWLYGGTASREDEAGWVTPPSVPGSPCRPPFHIAPPHGAAHRAKASRPAHVSAL